MSLDDFPAQDRNSEIAEQAEAAFERFVTDANQFIVQQRDRRDYGTDFQIVAKHSGGVSNFRVHVQLKGTEKSANKDGSISISVARTNLNYLLSQPNSIYVCYHLPAQMLLVRSAEDVFRDAERDGEAWKSQDSITVRFRASFDAQYQSALRAKIVAASSSSRDERLDWVVTPPEQFPERVAANVASIVVPESPDDAFNALRSLYDSHRDVEISKAFDQFAACLGADNPRLVFAYLSEINLAMRRRPFSRERVTAAIRFLESSRPDNSADVLYCRANGHCALRQTEEAKILYREAIEKAVDQPDLAAQCWKNLGTELELGGDGSAARQCYERALEHTPDLMEAHLALAMSHQKSGDVNVALQHFDQVVWSVKEPTFTLVARGWRMESYFRLGMADQAFDDIAVLLPHSNEHPWIPRWCARLVHQYSRSKNSPSSREIRFWDAFLQIRPSDREGKRERLVCLAYAKMNKQTVTMTYGRYVDDVTAYLGSDPTDAAFLWDRTGHWAQMDGDWEQAEIQYRKAYAIEPDKYGYCLGVALNHLEKFDEALPILLEQATTHQPDALSWFQVAISQLHTGNVAECKASFRRAIELDAEYAPAMFELGGVYWNHGPKDEAVLIWSEAIRRFPDHELTETLKRDFSVFFGGDTNA